MQQLTLPGIEFVPSKVRRYGLREFHHYPLVSYGKNAAGLWLGSWRVPAELAWQYPELELGRTGNSRPALIFDVDRPDWGLAIYDGDVPAPNWATWRVGNQHAHLVYALARPVVIGELARPTPQAWLARIGEYLALKLQADAAYSSALAHNPVRRGPYRTDWFREEPYTLEELAEDIPPGWRRPVAQPLTVYGRNETLFRAGMRWTGRPSHWGDWPGLATYLATMNAEFVLPLGERELGGIVQSIRRIQTKNLQSGQTQRTFSFLQAARGKKSAQARRAKTADRDAAIQVAYAQGQTQQAIADRHGITQQAVALVLRRYRNSL